MSSFAIPTETILGLKQTHGETYEGTLSSHQLDCENFHFVSSNRTSDTASFVEGLIVVNQPAVVLLKDSFLKDGRQYFSVSLSWVLHISRSCICCKTNYQLKYVKGELLSLTTKIRHFCNTHRFW